MGFKWRLEHEIVEEWRAAYIDYAKLKSLIEEAAQDQSLSSNAGDSSICSNINGHPAARRDRQQHGKKNSSKTRSQQRWDPSHGDGTSGESSSEQGRLEPTFKQRVIFSLLDDQLEDVEKFYTETLMKEARSRFKLIKEQLQELELHREEYRDAYKSINTALLPILVALRHLKERILPESGEGAEQKKIFGSHYKYEPHRLGAADRKLELAICEFYVYLGSIKNYCAINKEGFDKCAHKIEQELSIKCIKRYKDKVHNTKFSHSYALSDLQARTVALYSEDFGGKDKKKAAHHLRALTRPVTAKSFATARAGVFLGIALVFGTFALLNANHPATQRRIPQYATLLQIYGAFFLPVFLALTIGFNLIAWWRARVDTPVVFSFDRRTHLHTHEFFELPTFLLMTLSICMYLSFSIYVTSLPPQVWPLVWLWSTLAFFLNPFNVCHFHARWWIVRSLCRVLASGLIQVEFRDFFIGDQLCSLYYSIYNMYLLGCAYGHHFSRDVGEVCSTNNTWITPALASLPPVFRLGHSIRRYRNNPETKTHLVNIVKYGINILYQFIYYNWRIAGKFSLFVFAAALNAAVSYAWDVRVDWNLLNRGSRHTLLRDQLAYSNNIWFYYFAIAANLPLRFAWLLYLTGQDHTSLKGFCNSFLEVCRRCLWNFLRVESEHVGNVDDFRAVREVPLPYEKTGIDPAMKRTDPPANAHEDEEDEHSEEGEGRSVHERSPLKATGKNRNYGSQTA